MTDQVEKIEDFAKQLAKSEQADIYLYNGPINDRGYRLTLKAMSGERHVKKAILLITTHGGSAEAAYRIARWFQRHYSEFIVFPTSKCASAGTLITIGATQLMMSPFSELGPLDVQQIKRNEIAERKSGLIVRSALEGLQVHAIKFWDEFMVGLKIKTQGNLDLAVCADIATRVCTALFSEIYKQIDPDTLGKDERDLRVAYEYGIRLAEWSKNIKEPQIDALVNKYPSHDFIIGDEEVTKLFQKVVAPSEEMSQFVLTLGGNAFETITEEDKIVSLRLGVGPAADQGEGNAEVASNAA